MEYGYARVSTREQNEERQLIALREFGLNNGQIILDKQSGKDFNRCQYQRLLRKLKDGDTLVIKSIDRLGRIMKRFWSNGASSPRRRARLSSCWICRCSTRAGAAT